MQHRVRIRLISATSVSLVINKFIFSIIDGAMTSSSSSSRGVKRSTDDARLTSVLSAGDLRKLVHSSRTKTGACRLCLMWWHNASALFWQSNDKLDLFFGLPAHYSIHIRSSILCKSCKVLASWVQLTRRDRLDQCCKKQLRNMQKLRPLMEGLSS